MADEMDRVQAVNEWWQEECLAEHFRGRGTRDGGPANAFPDPRSLVPGPRCIDCGEEIPEKRRAAIPGCTRCIDCQTEFERRHR